MNRAIDALLEKGKIKDLREVLFSQIEKTKDMEASIGQALERIKSLEDISKVAFQKIGVVRFNPFNEMGGNQSFVIALLDKENSGFVISSLFIKEGNRMYAKSVVKGKSDYTLSAEEKEAIARAINPTPQK
ncbi:MAG: hypothetical protein A3A98_00110 [Candidatus Staskawiczbacteria bacterium RIFCSPLOWO2_01_FULL_40_39]|uniref:DUF4446 domain-containing protein n=1 Tax=Candidatus Staskawiczbacteria bacterium RIFCSPHIGHO2_01_FULL_39_25 TaxID=1802202 RepID=A0A1G2HN28_9BACT|nr:MAG: hypothetical protein A2730_00110 [Candidatus Staskawiczbacteria bacterium RIFCSPHIGHO2_01_FULL_39_25]OGZ73147.1 MAG: hypothetical protein A3A98_00110 [Candidatus Staskawiczbacteria bacterium RIFCSPLOWO2_01_FULL_40_39]OGZ76516.1 MAG: hypothetical protein A3I87_01180 [Candidatus Staskawiczbacteria bacterium RIFCSPLOWO2_02_FULL_39_8]